MSENQERKERERGKTQGWFVKSDSHNWPTAIPTHALAFALQIGVHSNVFELFASFEVQMPYNRKLSNV